MPRIYVEFDRFNQLGSKCQQASSKVDSIQGNFQSVIRQLDWDVRYQSNINNTASILAKKMQGYSKALDGYQKYLEEACKEYRKLDQYDTGQNKSGNSGADNSSSNPSFWDAFLKRYGVKNVIKSFGNTGKVVGLVDSALSATTWNQWANIGLSASQTISKIAKDFKNYKKIGRAIGTKNAVSYFLKKQVGLRNVGHASTASNPMSRFYNNLHNTTSSFNLKDAFAPLTGAKGVKTTVAAWTGVALTGVTNAFGNIQEQKDSNGTMSTGRVVAETISETALDTVITYGGSAVVGAAITAATGVVAAPVVVAVATGAGLAAINAGVEAWTGKSATEWASDFVLDTAVNVGKGISNGAKAVGNWFNNLSFAW